MAELHTFEFKPECAYVLLFDEKAISHKTMADVICELKIVGIRAVFIPVTNINQAIRLYEISPQGAVKDEVSDVRT